jgi:hypothetical protein
MPGSISSIVPPEHEMRRDLIAQIESFCALGRPGAIGSRTNGYTLLVPWENLIAVTVMLVRTENLLHTTKAVYFARPNKLQARL